MYGKHAYICIWHSKTEVMQANYMFLKNEVFVCETKNIK